MPSMIGPRCVGMSRDALRAAPEQRPMPGTTHLEKTEVELGRPQRGLCLGGQAENLTRNIGALVPVQAHVTYNRESR